MITIKYHKTIYILTDPNIDSVDNCADNSFVLFPSLDQCNDWWCFYKNDELEQISIFNSYKEAVMYVKLKIDSGLTTTYFGDKINI